MINCPKTPRNVSPKHQAVTELERAFELARTGEFELTEQLRRALRREGYSGHQTIGPTLLRQLRSVMKASRKAKGATERHAPQSEK